MTTDEWKGVPGRSGPPAPLSDVSFVLPQRQMLPQVVPVGAAPGRKCYRHESPEPEIRIIPSSATTSPVFGSPTPLQNAKQRPFTAAFSTCLGVEQKWTFFWHSGQKRILRLSVRCRAAHFCGHLNVNSQSSIRPEM